MKCFKFLNDIKVGVYYITDFDEHDTYLFKYIHHDVDWNVAGQTWTSRQRMAGGGEKIVEISSLTLLILLGESPEEIVRRVTGK